MAHKVCVVTGTRAEYGLLKGVLTRLEADDRFELNLVVTGSHLSKAFGNTQQEIIDDGFSFDRIEIPTDDDKREGMAIAAGAAVMKFADYFSKKEFELLIVLGDRFEILGAATSAFMMGIPVAHISGGDVTEGAIDDTVRHCLTKISSIHFPGCEQSAKRIIQMGEQPDAVYNVGEPGVENCLNVNLMTKEELVESTGFVNATGDFSVVTFHPVTMENNTGTDQVYELIRAMDAFSEMSYIVTMANADAGGRAINDIWVEEGKKHDNWLVVSSLGLRRYLSAMKLAKLVIGNSSSGIVEAPSMGTPTINIGDRQKGRMMAESVICCLPVKNEIVSAMEKGLSDDFQSAATVVKSPFGDGHTSEKIIEAIADFLNDAEKKDNPEKHFYDMEFNRG